MKLSIAIVDLAQLNFKEAQAKFLQLLADKTTPESFLVSAKRSLGQAYVGEGQYKKARDTFQELAQFKGFPEADKVTNQISIAQTFVAEKNYPAAQTELEKIKLYSRTVPSAQVTSDVWVGKILVFQKQFDKARIKFADVLRVDLDTFTAEDKMLVSLYQDIARLENALSFAREDNKVQALKELQSLIERPKVTAQVLAEAKKQLKFLQSTGKVASQVK